MLKTPNYELNIAQGTDTVNPLTVNNPNFERIDAEMFNNASASVGTATELLSGTVHALVRDNPNTSVFRFVATSDYKIGDTFTVDGVQVTGLLASGEPLGNKAYVINANVLCCLVGTLLTFYTTGGVVSEADNALKLGGFDAEHYGTAEDVESARQLAQASNNISLSNQTQINNLSERMETLGKFELMWKNPNVGGDFPAQDIVLPHNDYAFLIVTVCASTNSTNNCGQVVVPNGCSATLSYGLPTSGGKTNHGSRNFNRIDGTTYNVSSATRVIGDAIVTNVTGTCIPTHIYAYTPQLI